MIYSNLISIGEKRNSLQENEEGLNEKIVEKLKKTYF
jgi:hypothetical protein